MMKKYICPTIQVEETQAAQMLAESLKIDGNKEVDGSAALTKENDSWDIWEDK